MRLLTFLVLLPYFVFGQIQYTENNVEEKRIQKIIDIIGANIENNKWTNIMLVGNVPDFFYIKLKHLPLSIIVTSADKKEVYSFEGVTAYYSNTIVMSFTDLQDFERNAVKITQSPYWHQHSNVYLYCHSTPDKLLIAKLFFILWYYQACNVVLIHYDDKEEKLYVYNYSPYINDKLELENIFGCWTNEKLDVPLTTFEESFLCVENCGNVSLHSNLRANNMGTCMGLKMDEISYNDKETTVILNLFEDKGRNLQGFPLRALVSETLPFLQIEEHDNHTYTLRGRGGFIWNTLSKLMNFTIDMSPSANNMKNPFNLEVYVQHIFSLAHRKVDLYLVPLYQFDYSNMLEIDYTIPFEQSGVCILSHRAEFEIMFFDTYFLFKSYKFVIELLICNLVIWCLFGLFRFLETRQLTFDQIGKDMMNSVRTILLISLHKPPKQMSFRIFMLISMWSFFLISFATQAAIISLFTVVKRGKEINTLEDIIVKGYIIEGMASPDLMRLEDGDERLKQIRSKMVPTQGYFECVERLSNDSRRFCLVDCFVSRYLQENTLDSKGEQYIHIAEEKIHSYYQAFIFPKHSPMTGQVNKYMRRFMEAGLMKKMKEYKYSAMKDEPLSTVLKPLGLDNFKSIFKGYYILLTISVSTFFLEVIGARVGKIMCTHT